MAVRAGWIPEMPQMEPSRASALRADVVTTPCAGGNVVGCFNPCPGSEEIAATRTTGDGVGTEVQVVPSPRARPNSVLNILSLANLPFLTLKEDNPLYRTMWADLLRCGNLPNNLTPTQLHSLYEQMACHALWGVYPGAGNTWDFEAWHQDVDWPEALLPTNRCGERYGDVAAAGTYLQDKLVKSFDTHTGALALQTWKIDNLDGLLVRRNVATTRGYDCLLAHGAAPPHWYPKIFLDEYLADAGPDISDVEACGSTAPSGGGGSSGNSGASQPPPPPHAINAYTNYGTGAVGHAMCRGNPARPESMPGGTVTQQFTVPAGIATIESAVVQIDPDPTVTAHASLVVNGSVAAYSNASASGDTHFRFGAVPVRPGDSASLSISFTATSGKIITVYTVGRPGGVFSATNSCSDGAPSLSTSSTGLRAVISGTTG